MSELDHKKQLLINEFINLSKEKESKDILPLILALSNKASQAGIKFSKEDANLLVSQFENSMSPQEKKILPQLLSLIN